MPSRATRRPPEMPADALNAALDAMDPPEPKPLSPQEVGAVREEEQRTGRRLLDDDGRPVPAEPAEPDKPETPDPEPAIPDLLAWALAVQDKLQAKGVFGGSGTKMPLINLLLSAVMREVGPVAKNQYNEQQKFSFRGVDDVVNALSSAMRRACIFIRPVTVKRDMRDAQTALGKPTREVSVMVTYRLEAPDGTYKDFEVPGEALDQSDKGTAKAMSVALRIGLLQGFFLPTTEPDPDASYVTREGNAGLSAAAARMLERVLTTAPLEQVLTEGRAVITEHAAWDRGREYGPNADPAHTWGALYSARIARDITTLPGIDAARELAETLKAHDAGGVRIGEGTAVTALRARWADLIAIGKKTHDHCMLLVLDALGQDELDAAVEHLQADADHGALPRKEYLELLAVAEDRRPKLPEVAPEPEEAACDEPAVHEPHVDTVRDKENRPVRFRCPGVTEGQAVETAEEPQRAEPPWTTDEEQAKAWAAFKLRVEQAVTVGADEENGGTRSGMVTVALDRLLRDGEWGPAAAAFGIDGLVAVDDAIKIAHRRDHVLTDEGREYLDARLVTAYNDLAAALQPTDEYSNPDPEEYT